MARSSYWQTDALTDATYNTARRQVNEIRHVGGFDKDPAQHGPHLGRDKDAAIAGCMSDARYKKVG